MLSNLQTKDNFWNLMFWAGMCIGFSLSAALSPKTGGWIFWATLISVPYFIRKQHKLRLNADRIFVNSEGELLNDRYPKKVGIAFIASIAAFILLGMIMDALKVDLPKEAASIVLSFPILIFVLYFIFINCPISILFYTYTWSEAGKGAVTGMYFTRQMFDSCSNTTSSKNSYEHNALKKFTNTNTITDARYSGSSSNTFNSNHRR